MDVSFYLWTEPEQLFTLTCHVISIPSVKPDASLILWFQYEYGEKYQTISIKCFSSGVYFEAKRIIFQVFMCLKTDKVQTPSVSCSQDVTGLC